MRLKPLLRPPTTETLQAVTLPEMTAEPKFKIGQVVLFRPRASRGINAPLNHPYQVARRLPDTLGQYHYQIRCTVTDGEFTASESELRLATAR
jgi:hypothetical protein